MGLRRGIVAEKLVMEIVRNVMVVLEVTGLVPVVSLGGVRVVALDVINRWSMELGRVAKLEEGMLKRVRTGEVRVVIVEKPEEKFGVKVMESESWCRMARVVKVGGEIKEFVEDVVEKVVSGMEPGMMAEIRRSTRG